MSEISSTVPEIPFNILVEATSNWTRKNFLGKGNFSMVYKGTLTDYEVAVKKIRSRISNHEQCEFSTENFHPLEQILHEVKLLQSLAHENIIRLLGFSIDGEAACLVYEYMKNGSLLENLMLTSQSPTVCKPALNWIQRHDIALGILRGLIYLHTSGPTALIHGDLKSANILLDNKFLPKISDFGLARHLTAKRVMKVGRARGIKPYMPNEYLEGKNISTKVDTYSYGIILFELATGLSAYDVMRPVNKFLKDHVFSNLEHKLPALRDQRAGDDNCALFEKLITLGIWCSNRIETIRPEVTIVYERFNDYSLKESNDFSVKKKNTSKIM